MNKALIIGNLGADPDLRYLPNGDAAVTISIATNKKWTDRDSGEKKEHVEWHRCSAFAQRAETMAQYLKKGSKVFVEGELRTNKWTDKDGIDRYSTEIRVFNFEFLDSKPSDRPPHPADNPPADVQGRPAQAQRPAQQPAQAAQPAQPPGAQENPPAPQYDFEDDIPF